MSALVRLFDGDAPADAWPWDARATAYGDGLFETMRVHAGVIPWWDAHWSRLASGAARLRMRLPDEERVRREVDALCQEVSSPIGEISLDREIRITHFEFGERLDEVCEA